MAAYRRVYDSRHLQANCQLLPSTGISSGSLRSVIEYGLPLSFLFIGAAITNTGGPFAQLLTESEEKNYIQSVVTFQFFSVFHFLVFGSVRHM